MEGRPHVWAETVARREERVHAWQGAFGIFLVWGWFLGSWVWGCLVSGAPPPFLPFPPEMETFFLASSLTGLRILADPPGDPAASSGVEPQPPWSLCGFSAVRGAAGEAPGQTPRHTEGPPWGPGLSRKTTAARLSILTITLSPGLSSLSSNSWSLPACPVNLSILSTRQPARQVPPARDSETALGLVLGGPGVWPGGRSYTGFSGSGEAHFAQTPPLVLTTLDPDRWLEGRRPSSQSPRPAAPAPRSFPGGGEGAQEGGTELTPRKRSRCWMQTRSRACYCGCCYQSLLGSLLGSVRRWITPQTTPRSWDPPMLVHLYLLKLWILAPCCPMYLL